MSKKVAFLLAGFVAAVAIVAAAAWANRLTLLQHSLGWYTDIRHPRSANRTVPWEPATPRGDVRASTPTPQPNIVLILADDLGINDVSLTGGWLAPLGVPTPAIDSIARRGVRFEQGYAGSAVCTVSRAALLTGRYPSRFGLEFTPTPGALARVAAELLGAQSSWHPVVVDQAKASQVKDFEELGMPGSEVTLAEILKRRGYHTVHIGKWHLGGSAQLRPNAQGFDESLNMESGLYLPEHHPLAMNSKQPFDPIDRYLWPNMRYAVSYNAGSWFEPRGYLTDYFTDEAVEVIRKNRSRPFFLYLAHWAVHTPLQASRQDYDAVQTTDSRRRVYGAMVRALDRSVARILDELDRQRLLDNTIVVFASDNGAPGYLGLPDVNKPYRGWKLTFFEGGLRVPFYAMWPGHIAAGTVYRQPVGFIDVLPTLGAAAGAPLPSDRVVDGVNLLPFLESSREHGGTRPLFWQDGPLRAVRAGRWKLISASRPPKDWLFDLEADPTETTNLAASLPQKLAEMKRMLADHARTLPEPMWPSFIEVPVAIDKTLEQAPLAGDEYTYWYN